MKYDITKSKASSRTLCMPHQQDAVDALNNYYDLISPQCPQSGLVVMPTGSGKTFMTVNWLLNSGVANGYRILWLVHRQELVDQTYSEFEKQLGDLSDYGVKTINMMKISGSRQHYLMSQASRQDIYVCSILSVASKNGRRFIRRMLGTPGAEKLIVVIDEAHHATAPSYEMVLKRIDSLNPKKILLGLTATPVRMSPIETHKLNRMFHAIPETGDHSEEEPLNYIYEISLSELIKTGFLANPTYKYIQTKIQGDVEYNLTDEENAYFNRFGDLSESLKKKVANSQSRNQMILQEYLDNRKLYGKTLVFAINQLHAELLSRLFTENGVKCDHAISDRGDSAAVIENFKKGKSGANEALEVLINVQMLTEGSDIPDIQSVFITRETNSDSLLMQMVGRGLRGTKAGGTEEANIVSFHDNWDRLNFWMRPEFVTSETIESLDSPEPANGSTSIGEIEGLEGTREEKTPGLFQPEGIGLALRDLYEKLYLAMKVNITSEVVTDLIPDGWFSVLAEDGVDFSVPVYVDQLVSYQLLEASSDWVILNRPSARQIVARFFKTCHTSPVEEEMNAIIEYIIENERMPDYYTFNDRNKIDPAIIGQEMLAYSNERDAQIYWLESYYKSHGIVQQIYRSFLAFRKSVMDALEKPREAELHYIDDRSEFEIVPGHHDLEDLWDQVLQQYPALGEAPVHSISWSQYVVKRWFGMCYALLDGTYTIFINRLLCSPLISEEAIKYLIYHELLHANGFWDHNDEFRHNEWKYPNSDELDGELDEILLRYAVDFKSLKKIDFANLQLPEDKIDAKSTSEPGLTNDVGSGFVEAGPTDNAKPVPKTEPAGDIKSASDTGLTPISLEVRKQKFCRNCGNKLPIKAKFCDVCGANTSDY